MYNPTHGQHYYCPVCRTESLYDRTMDRLHHVDGSANDHCWWMLTTGRADDRYRGERGDLLEV